MSAPERREPQSEAALDSRPLFPLLHPSPCRSPLHTTVPESSSPYQPPPPSLEDDRSLSFFPSRSGPTIRPQPQPLPLPPALSPVPVRGVCRISPLPTSSPSRSLPTLLRLLAPPLSPHPLSLSFSFSPSLAYLRLLTTFTRSSVSAPPCQFLCETTNGACSLPTYLATYPASWLATYFHKIRWRL